MNTDAYVPVPIGACQCPGAPHEDGDVVSLRRKLGLKEGIAVQRLVLLANRGEGGMTEADATGVLAEGYLLYGVAEWNLSGDTGPLPVNRDTIRTQLLEDFSRGAPVADAADSLYMAAVIAPLVPKAVESLSSTLSNGSTSVTRNGSRKAPKRSRRSSTTTSPTADTEATSS